MSDQFLPLFFEKKSFKRLFAGMFVELHCMGVFIPAYRDSPSFGVIIFTLGAVEIIGVFELFWCVVPYFSICGNVI